ncbi:uncharacterized protein YALI1_A19010g [Yarrowia lipolytica]|uniref:Uncharacterized protein n=1 Tax=Yarrowia lipolytica TaxID=4952 RepID=A0A1D8N5B8_YARLL|nr:hypothetical protein YALI1_A19010g [Yarrowia lipolytica]
MAKQIKGPIAFDVVLETLWRHCGDTVEILRRYRLEVAAYDRQLGLQTTFMIYNFDESTWSTTSISQPGLQHPSVNLVYNICQSTDL